MFTFKYINLKCLCINDKIKNEVFWFCFLKNACIIWITQILPVGIMKNVKIGNPAKGNQMSYKEFCYT